MRIYIKTIISMLVLYVFQFVIVPWIVPQYYPRSNEAVAIFVIMLIIIAVIMELFIEKNMFQVIVSDLVYMFLVFLYSGNGAYGIGMRGINLDGLQASYSKPSAIIDAIVTTGIVFIIQLIIKGLSKVLSH